MGFPGGMGAPAAPVGYGGQPQGPWAAPASYGGAAPMTYGGQAMPGNPYCDPGSPPRHDPDDLIGDGWIEQKLEYIFSNARFRLDYMHWSLDTPGNVLLGSEVAGVREPRQPFPVVDRITGAAIGLGAVPTLDLMSLRDVSGMRGTIEIPFKEFTFEYNAWFTQQTGDRYSIGADHLGGNLVVTSLTQDGVVVPDNTVAYNVAYNADLTTELWGTEGNVILADNLASSMYDGYRLALQPMFGFRYVQLKERLQQNGIDTNGVTGVTRTAVIDSENTNNLYGPTIGLRAEVRGKWLTFGVQPKMTFGLNDYAINTSSQNLLAASELRRQSRENHVEYAPVFEFNAYLKCHINESLALHVGYDFMWMDRVARPWNTINYDSTGVGVGSIPNINTRDHLRDFYLQGLTVGGEFRL